MRPESSWRGTAGDVVLHFSTHNHELDREFCNQHEESASIQIEVVSSANDQPS